MPTIGTCSNCHGPVQTPELWSGDMPPVPTCTSCGATAKNPYGPVIPMTPTKPRIEDIVARLVRKGGQEP